MNIKALSFEEAIIAFDCTADFFCAPKFLVFVDGSPHSQNYVQIDEANKRRWLQKRGYAVVVGDSLYNFTVLKARLVKA